MIELILIEASEGSLVLRVRQWLPGFVPASDEQPGPRYQRPGDGELLLLPAGEIAAPTSQHVSQHREQIEDITNEPNYDTALRALGISANGD